MASRTSCAYKDHVSWLTTVRAVQTTGRTHDASPLIEPTHDRRSDADDEVDVERPVWRGSRRCWCWVPLLSRQRAIGGISS